MSKFNPWPVSIVAVFICLAIGNFFLLNLALNSKSSYFEEHPYESGLNYEQIINGKNNAKKQGLSLSYSFSAIENSNLQLIKIQVLGPTLSKDAELKLQLIRPDDAKLDKNLKGRIEDNQFLTSAELRSGLWLTRAEIENQGKPLYFESRELLP